MHLHDVIIILSRPSEAGNTGAVCRAMKNMGLTRLRLVAPDHSAAMGTLKARAIHAWDVWEKAETFDTLAAAVKDCTLVIGTTRRRGRRRKQVTMTPREIAAFLKDHPGQAAIVFGNERTGLEDDELAMCNMASHIPVDEVFPSLNLSHAVQIYAYELFCALVWNQMPPWPAPKGQWVPMDEEAIESLVRQITGNLKLLGFYKQKDSKEQETFFRDIFSRAGITEREGRYFAEIMAKAAWLGKNKSPP